MFMKMAMHVVIFLINFLVGTILGADGKNGVFKIKAEGNCNLQTRVPTKTTQLINSEIFKFLSTDQ